MTKYILLILSSVIIGGIAGYAVYGSLIQDFTELSPAEIRDNIIAQRDFAIARAVEAGDYRCCIDPPCTMCFMEGNEWNNNTPGTCACDDLIAEGKEPCPQCNRGIDSIHNDNNIYCDVDATVPTCSSESE